MTSASRDTSPDGNIVAEPVRAASSLWSLWRTSRPEDLPIVILPTLYLVGAYCVLTFVSAQLVHVYWLAVNFAFYVKVIFLVIVAELVARLAVVRPASPVVFAMQHWKNPRFLANLATAMPVLLALSFFMTMFSALKSAIPLINDFGWDQTWIELDRTIHGDDAWRVLQPLLGHPLITAGLSAAYHFWFLLIYIGPVYFALFHRDRTMRARFFLGYFLTWIVCGTVLAITFASVGPCFLEPLLGDPRFSEQMAYLHAVNEQYPLLVIEIQQQILFWYHHGDHGLGRGITAMPSMHVSLAFLYFLVMRQIDRRLGWIFGAFCALIFLGSVHLAYHYAVDGYLAIAVTALIWAATGPMARYIMGDRQSEALSPEVQA